MGVRSRSWPAMAGIARNAGARYSSSGQSAEHLGRMPMTMFHTRLDPCPEAIGIRRRVRPEVMSCLIAVVAGGDDIGAVPSAILLGYQVLGGGL